MRRAALLHCVDISITRFNVLRQREQLPFYAGGNENVGRWREYSLNDAFALRLMIEFMDGYRDEPMGLPPSVAVRMATGYGLDINSAAFAKKAIWVGYAGFSGETNAGDIHHGRAHFAGTLDELDSWMTDEVSSWDDAFRSYGGARLFLVNATKAAREVLTRAEEMGVV